MMTPALESIRRQLIDMRDMHLGNLPVRRRVTDAISLTKVGRLDLLKLKLAEIEQIKCDGGKYIDANHKKRVEHRNRSQA